MGVSKLSLVVLAALNLPVESDKFRRNLSFHKQHPSYREISGIAKYSSIKQYSIANTVADRIWLVNGKNTLYSTYSRCAVKTAVMISFVVVYIFNA